MKEIIPPKEKGSVLYAREVNEIGKVVNRLGKMRPGSFMEGRHSGSMMSFSQRPPLDFGVLEISNRKIYDSDTNTSGLYLGKMRSYTFDSAEWESDSAEWIIDATDTYMRFEATDSNANITGHRVFCFWDGQRGAFMPLHRVWPSQERKVKITQSGGITAGGFGTANVWENGIVTNPLQTISKLYFNWMDVGTAGQNKEAIARWMDDEQKWIIVELEC